MIKYTGPTEVVHQDLINALWLLGFSDPEGIREIRITPGGIDLVLLHRNAEGNQLLCNCYCDSTAPHVQTEIRHIPITS